MNTATESITPQERAKRQEAYDFAIASVRLEGMVMPPKAVKIMLAYVEGDITKEEEKAGILALLQ
jgi:Antitoxin VbhA